MGLKSIFGKTLRDRKRTILGWCTGFLIYAFFILSLYPTFSSENEVIINYIKLFSDMPFLKLFGINSENILEFTTPEGFLNPEFFYMVAPLLIIILSIALGSDAIAGEEERKTMDLLLSNPISRSRIVLEKFLAMTFIIFLVLIFSYIGFLISIFLYKININVIKILQSEIMLGLLGLSFGSLAFSIGCITGNRGKSIAISSVIAVISYLINALSNISSLIRRFRFISLFYYYGGDNPLKKGIYFPHLIVIISFILILLMISLLSFEKRDIKI
ncbi:MAG: ABC transporter permease [Dictyoglomaceae bacterium]|nr:ABC transporter permease [Dictyoglomaceae bacterium]